MNLAEICRDYLSNSLSEMETLVLARRNARRAIFLTQRSKAAPKARVAKQPPLTSIINSMTSDDRNILIKLLEGLINENKN